MRPHRRQRRWWLAAPVAFKAASTNVNSALVVFAGSEHSKEFVDYPQRYLSVVFSFIDQQLSAGR